MADAVLACRMAAVLSAPRGVVDRVLGAATREVAVAGPRQLAMYLAHVVLGLSQGEVGRQFGRDRRTIAYACRQVEVRREDAAFDGRVSEVERLLLWVMGR
ncbi:helix-turn-helix domain-containing protein [Xanthobacteraceae bacterium A53D]